MGDSGNQFTLDDFLRQLERIRPLVQFESWIAKVLGIRKVAARNRDLDQSLSRIRGIYQSMTAGERSRPEVLDGSRRRRIAAGAGASLTDVGQLLRHFEDMRTLMRRAQSVRFPIPLKWVLGLATNDRLHRDPSFVYSRISDQRWRHRIDLLVLALALAGAVFFWAHFR